MVNPEKYQSLFQEAAPDLPLMVDGGTGPESHLPSPCQQPAAVTLAASLCFHLIHLVDAGRISAPPPHQSPLSDSVTPRDPRGFTWVSAGRISDLQTTKEPVLTVRYANSRLGLVIC